MNETQIDYLTSNFMRKLKANSVSAMKEVLCFGKSINSAAIDNNVTRQSLSKNLNNLYELRENIISANRFLTSGYLLTQNTEALLMADISFSEASTLLKEMCLKLGGKFEYLNQEKELRLYLNDTMVAVYSNLGGDFQYEWGYETHET